MSTVAFQLEALTMLMDRIGNQHPYHPRRNSYLRSAAAQVGALMPFTNHLLSFRVHIPTHSRWICQEWGVSMGKIVTKHLGFSMVFQKK